MSEIASSAPEQRERGAFVRSQEDMITELACAAMGALPNGTTRKLEVLDLLARRLNEMTAEEFMLTRDAAGVIVELAGTSSIEQCKKAVSAMKRMLVLGACGASQ